MRPGLLSRILLVTLLVAVTACRDDSNQSQSGGTTPVKESPSVFSSLDELPPEVSRLLKPWHGDLDGMIERRLIRVVTVFNPMLYFLDGPRQRGVVYEATAELEKILNKKLGKRRLRVDVVLIPVARHDLIPALVEGRGDIAAANLTITPERLESVDFSIPTHRGIVELLVTGPSAPAIDTLEDLAGSELHLRPSSSYWSSVETLNEALRNSGKTPVRLVPVSEWVEDNALLELVDSGDLAMTVVDSHKGQFWGQFYNSIVIRDDLSLRSGGEIGWAFRKGSPELAKELNGFLRKHRKGTLFGNVVYNRYLVDNKWVKNSVDSKGQERFREMADLFRRYGDRYDLDWLLVAAQGYQESRLDQSLKSRAGAVGVMQLLPRTAAYMDLPDVENLESNIHAGVKYLRYLMDEHFADVDPLERQHLALAAYNAGPSRIKKARRQAAAAGLDPDVWYQNVEVATARHIGAEPVRYVRNISKYYAAYRLLALRVEQTVPL